MNKDRILDLADIIKNDRLPNVRFDMRCSAIQDNTNRHTCATVACIAGYAVCAAYGNKRAKREDIPTGIIEIEAQAILGLNSYQAETLFYPTGLVYRTKEEAAKVLRNLAKTGKVIWP